MTAQPSPYDLIRAIQDQQRATDRLVQILAGMLDKTHPEPLLSFQPPAPVLSRPAPRKLRRVSGPSGRPPAELIIDGVTISTTERRAKVLQALQEQPRGLSDLVRLGFAPRTNAMMAQIVDINRDLDAAGSTFQIKAQPRPARSSGRGSIAPKYALVKFSETAAPEDPPAVQSEAAAGESPEEWLGERAAGTTADVISAQPDQFVTSTGGEVATLATESPPVADVPTIERLAAVLVDKAQVFGPGGSTFVNTRAARILDVLKHGDLFGLDVVAKKAKVMTAQDCRHALRIEVDALKSIGLEVWTDKLNARLREAP